MTIAIAMKINDGIILATDSASTILGQNENGDFEVHHTYFTADKLFNLQKGNPIGAITWGDGSVNNESISTLVKDFRKKSKNIQYSYVENKIKSSGEHIIRLFKEWGFEINDIKCFYLGKYDSQDNPKNKKGKRSKKYNDCMISIRGLNRSDTTIYTYDCGTLLNDLYPVMKI